MSQFDARNISMVMDLYELTMAGGYFSDDAMAESVTFDVFYRAIPTTAASPSLQVWSRSSNSSRISISRRRT